eukprot:16955-Hanusia_phi.AAC.1
MSGGRIFAVIAHFKRSSSVTPPSRMTRASGEAQEDASPRHRRRRHAPACMATGRGRLEGEGDR